MPTFLVTGATGSQGGSVVRELLALGAKVHAYVRDSSKPAAKELETLGATLLVGDFNDVDAIARALVGVKGIFLNPIPDFADADAQRAQVQRFIDAEQACVPRTVDTIVISTVHSTAHHAEWLSINPNYPMSSFNHSKVTAEEAVLASGVKNLTILRPPWLMSNYVAPMCYFHFPSVASGGDHVIELRTAIRLDMPIAHLDPRDIGRLASAAFLRPEDFAGKVIAPGWRNITIVDAVHEIEQIVGKTIKIVPITVEELKRSPGPESFMGHAWEWANEDLDESGKLGVELRSLKTYLEDHKDQIFPSLPSQQ
ncbi:NAD dependent epimerase/dehydratase [Auriculariales sp. MPI-PUGE-AT-0066]|nr:NAD dependent epimerase/dehydratase [Auriculariales sp. MPI-PUGE-AT-0066]